MADVADVPKVGPVDKKYLWAGGALVAGIVFYAYWKDRRAASGTTTAPDPNAIDPATGLPYSAETGATAASGVGSVANASGYGTGPATVAITTDQQWAQAVEQDPGLSTFDPNFLSTTLGKYLSGQALTNDEATLVRTAWAFQGQPPGREPIKLVTTGSTPGGGTTGTPPATPSGLHVISTQVTTGSVGLGWNAVAGATGYRVGVRNNSNSTNPWSYQDIGAGTSTTVGALHSKTNYEFTLQARNAAGLSGYPAAVFQTTK